MARGAAGASGQPHLVQRLDKDTSGLVVVAKSRDVHAGLQRGPMVKEYLALVWGRPAPPRGRIDTPLGRDPLDRRRVMVSTDGTASVTVYRTLARTQGPARGLSLLGCHLVTGRTHQLRVHLADRGWPLVGDPVYRSLVRTRITDARLHRAAATFGRQALHAWRVRFMHPRRGVQVDLEAEPPPDLQALLDWLAIGRPRGGRTPSADTTSTSEPVA